MNGSRRCLEQDDVGALILFLALIHPSAWKGNSPKFGFIRFSEVGILSSTILTRLFKR